MSPGIADMFEDACRIMNADSSLRSRSHIVGHLCREIETALHELVPNHGYTGGTCPKCGKATGSHKDKVAAALHALQITAESDEGLAWRHLVRKLARLAHRNGLDSARPMDDEFDKTWQAFNKALSAVLTRIESNYAQFHEQIDDLPMSKDPREIAARAAKMPRDPALQDYFFQRVHEHFDPRAHEFLEPLRSEKFFEYLPQVVDDGERISHPPWPVGKFLASVAGGAPETASKILASLPESPNRFVLQYSLEAALALPDDLLARWTRGRLRPWRRARAYFDLILAEKLGMVAARLLAGHPPIALGVASLLFSPARSAASEADTEDAKARLRIDDYEAKRLIEAHLELAARIRPFATITFFAKQLERVLANHGDAEHPFGHPSSWWHPSIGDSSQNVYKHTPRVVYLNAVRDACMQAATEVPGSIAQVVALLVRRKPTVFKRIALHVLRAHHEPQLVSQMVLDQATMLDPEFHHEYWALAATALPQLEPDVRAELIRRIMAGPGDDEIVAVANWGRDRPASVDEARGTLAWWRLKRLVLLEAHMNEEERNLLRAELAITGARPEHPEFLSYHEVGSGHASPVGIDELRSMLDGDLIQWLKTWEPPPRTKFKAPTREGLALILTQLVAEAPDRLLPLSRNFLEVDPTYCRGVLDGFERVAQKAGAIDWQPVVALIREVGKKPVGRAGDLDHDLERDTSWGPCRHHASSLLRSLMEKELPALASRQEVWSAIEGFLGDPSPDIGADHGDPITTAINSVRGNALQAAFFYCNWLKKGLPNWAGLATAPETVAVLRRHVDARQERSVAIHALYGWMYQFLFFVDADWATDARTLIFPLADDLREYRDAAWVSFLSSHPAHPSYLKALQSEYERAVADIGGRVIEKQHGKEPEQALGEHLLALYWQGEVELEAGSLLVRFFDAADDELRGHVISSVGRSLKNAKDMDDFCRQRLMRFWEARLVVGGNVATRHLELASFAWWFAATEFPGEWALKQILQVVRSGAGVDPEFLFFERLAELSAEHGKLAVGCLKTLLDTQRELRELTFHKDEVHAVLQAGMKTGDPEAVQQVKEIVNRLAFNEMPQFREVLATKPSQPGDGAP
ncbi:MAG: hypothetical protein JNK78_01370 [Planctomycetes bacterium]|nr:hypothetical protein [Planctomycetota bacterium]